MDDDDAARLNAAVLDILSREAPWVAEQIEESVRQGSPMVKKVKRPRGGRPSEFVETTVLTISERLRITLDAIERVLVDPAPMLDEVTRSLKGIGVRRLEFGERESDVRYDLGRLLSNSSSSEHLQRVAALVGRFREDINNVG